VNAVDRALALVSILEGVRSVEHTEDGSVHVYVNSVDTIYSTITHLFQDYAPQVHGQVRGPSFPVGPRHAERGNT
jgi:hypothetical protein